MLAGCEMGDVKLEDAAMAMPIIKTWGDIPRLAEFSGQSAP